MRKLLATLLLGVQCLPALAEVPSVSRPLRAGESCSIGVSSRGGCNDHAGSIFWEIGGKRYAAGACGYHEFECRDLLRVLRRQVRACYGEDIRIRESPNACQDPYR